MSNNNLLHFAKRLKILRKRNKITQEKLAELINRSPNHISKIEQGEVNPPLSLVFDIAKALNIDVYELFCFNDEPIQKIEISNIKKELDNINTKELIKLFKIYQIIKNS